MKTRYLAFIGMLLGAWLIASSLTVEGLVPSGHGTGRFSELLIGGVALAWSMDYYRKSSRSSR